MQIPFLYLTAVANDILGAQGQIAVNFTIGMDLVMLPQSYNCTNSENFLKDCQITSTTNNQAASVICQGSFYIY